MTRSIGQPLSPRVEAFLAAKLAGATHAQAYVAAYPEKSPGRAGKAAGRLMARPAVRRRLAALKGEPPLPLPPRHRRPRSGTDPSHDPDLSRFCKLVAAGALGVSAFRDVWPDMSAADFRPSERARRLLRQPAVAGYIAALRGESPAPHPAASLAPEPIAPARGAARSDNDRAALGTSSAVPDLAAELALALGDLEAALAVATDLARPDRERAMAVKVLRAALRSLTAGGRVARVSLRVPVDCAQHVVDALPHAPATGQFGRRDGSGGGLS